MGAHINVDLSQFPTIVNKAYYPIFHNESRFLVLYGGAGSGKSVTAAEKIIYRFLLEPNHKYLAARKVADTVRESCRAELIGAIKMMGVDSLFKYGTSPSCDMTIIGPNNNTIIFRGFDDVEKLKSLKGLTGAWLEEASEFTKDDMDQLNLRIRGQDLKNYKQIILTFNPISEHHWLKSYFFDNPRYDATVIKTTYKDNSFIDDEYKQTLELLKDTNPSFYKVYALGEWGSLKGRIYDKYTVVPGMPESFEDESLGLDFGFMHPQAFVHIRFVGNRIYLDEIFYETGITNKEFIATIKSDRPELLNIPLYPDTARPDLISELEDEGFDVMQTDKAVFDGIMTVKGRDIHVTSRSKNIIRELKLYSWKQAKDGQIKDEPSKLNDHIMDAIRYGVHSHVNQQRGYGGYDTFDVEGLR